MAVDHSKLIVGKTYHVGIGDCCVVGEFTATLEDALGDDSEYYDSLYFSNGVTLTEYGQVSFSEVE